MNRLAIHWNKAFNEGKIQIIDCSNKTQSDDLDEKFRSLGYLEKKHNIRDGMPLVPYIDKIDKLY